MEYVLRFTQHIGRRTGDSYMTSVGETQCPNGIKKILEGRYIITLAHIPFADKGIATLPCGGFYLVEHTMNRRRQFVDFKFGDIRIRPDVAHMVFVGAAGQ